MTIIDKMGTRQLTEEPVETTTMTRSRGVGGEGILGKKEGELEGFGGLR